MYGTVTSFETLQPLADVTVAVFSREDSAHVVKTTTTDSLGKFLLSGLAIGADGSPFDVRFSHTNFKDVVYKDVLVVPGAPSSLALTPSLSKTQTFRYLPTDFFRPLHYHFQSKILPKRLEAKESLTTDSTKTELTVFATREGLVGYTTANGHVIKNRDKFVALPSRRGLNPNDQQDYFAVKLTKNNLTTIAPVWDIGPWNTTDDYWNPSQIRQRWNDLPVGMPESQQAYQNGYNNGKDQFNRTVLNPAGIDLADGTFWDDLKLTDNSWILVEYLWRLKLSVGDSVQTLTTVNVRNSPGGDLLGSTSNNQMGVIQENFVGASLGSSFYIWWKVKWSDSFIGWVAEPFIRKYSADINLPPNTNDSISLVLTVNPNPFNNILHISYTIPEDGLTTAKLYTIRGQLIETIFSSTAQKGSYHLTYHTNNLASGLYFLVFEHNNRRIIKKMVHLQ